MRDRFAESIFLRKFEHNLRRDFHLSANESRHHATPKMNNWHAGSAVAAVLAALKLPLQKKMLGYFLSSGWARHNYSISFK